MRILIDVDLPAPFGPMYATRSPASTERSRSRTASMRRRARPRPVSNTLVSPHASIATPPGWPIETQGLWLFTYARVMPKLYAPLPL